VTVRERVRRIQLGLEVVAVLAAGLWGAAAAVATSLVLADTRVSILVGAAAAAIVLRRSRFAWAFDRVALWIEERAPELAYAVVTASDTRYSAALTRAAEPMLERANASSFVRRAGVRSLAPALAALAAALALSAVIPVAWRNSLTIGRSNSLGGATTESLLAGSKLARLTARIVPPPYTNLRTEEIREPATIAGVRGTRVIIEGDGSSSGVTASIAAADGHRSALGVTGAGIRWQVILALADTTPALLELDEGKFTRSIVLDPRADAPPSVKLRLPARDTVLRIASGTLRLSADASDDIGLGPAQFEYIISSGSEETFSFRQGTLGATRFDGKKMESMETAVPLAFFKLGEGDRLSIRAVASDLNTMSGPGRGFSETRTIRIARKDEYDSLSVEAAAPSGDTAMLSLRMLILETEQLEKERATIPRENLVARSRVLARQTDRIQDEVLPLFKEEGTAEAQVTMDTESTERPVPVTSTLKQAVDALGQASRDLDVADPRSALPEMYKAYRALQSYRTFRRYYLRGATRPIIVDIQRVRLTGKTKGAAAPMNPRTVASSSRDRMRLEYSAAIEQIRSAPGKAVTMLAMIRVESLKQYPALASAIEEALSAIGRGGDVTSPLLKVRRLLEGVPVRTDSLPAWSGGW
jgi:hypothetical protein